MHLSPVAATVYVLSRVARVDSKDDAGQAFARDRELTIDEADHEGLE
jgi:hypothetical protein